MNECKWIEAALWVLMGFAFSLRCRLRERVVGSHVTG
jgi:hypothetical protein